MNVHSFYISNLGNSYSPVTGAIVFDCQAKDTLIRCHQTNKMHYFVFLSRNSAFYWLDIGELIAHKTGFYSINMLKLKKCVIIVFIHIFCYIQKK